MEGVLLLHAAWDWLSARDERACRTTTPAAQPRPADAQ